MKVSPGRVFGENQGEQWIGCEEKIHPQGSRVPRGKPLVSFFFLEPWNATGISGSHDEIHVSGIPPFDMLQQGQASNQDMGDLPFGQTGKHGAERKNQFLFVSAISCSKNMGVANDGGQIKRIHHTSALGRHYIKFMRLNH
jgi:hypothetical protein